MSEALIDRRSRARAHPVASDASLKCRIRARDGSRIEGNLQIEIKHQASGSVWKNFRYRNGEHIFRGLPLGLHSVRVNAAGLKPVNLLTTLIAPEHILDIVLDGDHRDHLVIAAGNLREQYAADVPRRPGDRTSLREGGDDLRLRLTSRLMNALIRDRAVTGALVNASGAPAAIAKWIEAQIRSAWRFRATPDVADRLVAGLVAARLRLFATTCAVFRNPSVKQLCPDTSDEDVRLHVCRFLATLDCPQLDGVHPILVELFEPQRSCVERFLRAVQNEFSLRAERGTATPAASPSAMWSPERFRYTDLVEAGSIREDGASAVAASQYWLIADALAWALGHPSWQQ
jgi:hypothetical protein